MANIGPGDKCEFCVFWRKFEVGPRGNCMRMPPQIIVDPNLQKVQTLFPVTAAKDVCGEWMGRR